MPAFLTDLNLSVYALLSLIAVLTNIIFAFFVTIENPQGILNRLWSLTILSLIFWGCGEFIMRVTKDASVAELTNRITGVGFCLIPAQFLHFALAFGQGYHILSNAKILALLYLPAAVFSLLQINGYVTKVIHLHFGFTSTPTDGYTLYIIWLELYFLYGLYLCYQRLRSSKTRRERLQSLFMILAVVIPLTIGSVADAFLPMMGIETVRIAVVATTITAGLITFAILRFQLMALTPQTTAANILSTMGDLLSVVDVAGFVQYTNPAFESVLGYRGRQARLHLKDFVQEHDMLSRSMAEIADRHALSKNLYVHYRSKDGGIIPISLLVSAVYDSRGSTGSSLRREEVLGFVLLARDITEEIEMRRRLDETVRRHTEDLERFAALIQQAQEDERQRIARELHDDICQRLSALKLYFEVFRHELPTRNQRTKRKIDKLMAQIDSMILEVRRISSNLRPATLDDFGLLISLRLLCKEMGRTRRLKITFEADEEKTPPFDKHVEIALYRIAQEALSNVLKHSRAKRLTVRLAHINRSVELSVHDDGTGFDIASFHGQTVGEQHVGLLSMRERAELLGGRFEIQTAPGKGTSVRVQIPLR
ncbi:MAG TPA: histidine kinase [Bacteroidota bacterium]|nr:histidine kinase [Bacteroidota bacterium]